MNITTIQERLQLFQQDARLQRINAELRPGVKRGESELNVKVTERSPYRLWAEYNNFQTPTVGENRGLGTFSHENLFGLGDPFRFTYARSEGVDPLIDTSYALPLTPYDTILTSSFRLNDFTVVEEPFDFLDIESQTQVIGFTLRHPVIRSLNQELGLALTGEWEYNKTQSKFLVSVRDQGIPVNPNLIPGSTDTGVNIVSALRFTPDWIYRTQDAVLALRSRFSFGLDVLDATVNSGVDANGFQIPDAQFFSWLGSVQAVKRFDNLAGIQLLGRFDMQLANDALFPLEQYPVGGRYTVRGYRENTFVRDNAIVTSVEARLPVWRYASGEDMFQLAPFFDYGSAWNNGDEPPLSGGGAADLGYLASVGIGLRWTVLPQNRAYYEIYWGHKINDIDQGSGTLQDEGIHMQFVLQIF